MTTKYTNERQAKNIFRACRPLSHVECCDLVPVHPVGPLWARRCVQPENRSWPRENTKNTKQNGLSLNVEGRPDAFPLQSFLRSALCALCVPLRQFNFGVRVKPGRLPVDEALRARDRPRSGTKASSGLICVVGTSRCDVPARKAGGTGAGSTSADGAAHRPYQFRTAPGCPALCGRDGLAGGREWVVRKPQAMSLKPAAELTTKYTNPHEREAQKRFPDGVASFTCCEVRDPVPVRSVVSCHFVCFVVPMVFPPALPSLPFVFSVSASPAA